MEELLISVTLAGKPNQCAEQPDFFVVNINTVTRQLMYGLACYRTCIFNETLIQMHFASQRGITFSAYIPNSITKDLGRALLEATWMS